MGFTDSIRDGGEAAPLALISALLPTTMRSTIVGANCVHGDTHRALLIQSTSGDGVVLFCDNQWLVADVVAALVSQALGGMPLRQLSFMRLAGPNADVGEVAALLSASEIHATNENLRMQDRRAQLATEAKARDSRNNSHRIEIERRENAVRANARWLIFLSITTVVLLVWSETLHNTPDPDRASSQTVASMVFISFALAVLMLIRRLYQNRTIKQLKRELAARRSQR